MWFLHVWICHIWIIHVWIFPMWRHGETPDLRSERHFPTEYGKPFKSRLQRMKMPKIDLYHDSKSSCPSVHLRQRKPPVLRPFIAAKETGGLDFLIAHALMILCHSLFEVVIMIARSRRKSPDTFKTFQSIAAVSKKKAAPANAGRLALEQETVSMPRKCGAPHGRGGRFCAVQAVFRQRRKPWHRGTSFALSTFISHGASHKNSHTFRCGYFYGGDGGS